MRLLYKSLGVFFVGLGILGAFLPVLPTTPFLLLALWLFARSSPRLENWLLTNRLCGRYIRDYRSGRGIPRRVKAYTLILLWGTITLSACLIGIWWVAALLLAVAAGVSIHILRFKTNREMKKITLLAPTETEAVALRGVRGCADVVVCGAGMAETAAAVVRVLAAGRPDLLVLAGIAGAAPGGGLNRGDCAVVAGERIADLGAWRGDRFEPLFGKRYECPAAAGIACLPRVEGMTVDCGDFAGLLRAAGAGRDDAGSRSEVAVENMEGAAFFAACLAAGVPFIEVRAVSNFTGDPRAEWRMDEALESLRRGVEAVIAELNGAGSKPRPIDIL